MARDSSRRDAEAALHSPNIDRLAHVWIARATAGLSPASLMAAYQDWVTHLAISPAKQLELIEKAWHKVHRLVLHAWASQLREAAQCIEPLPQDKRFSEPEWQRWPYNLIYQGFLLTQQWWWNATTGIRSVSTSRGGGHVHRATIARHGLAIQLPAHQPGGAHGDDAARRDKPCPRRG
jgi:hypothetical protein